MINFKKQDYDLMANHRKIAFKRIAEKLGNEHPITKMMGSMAWGRNKAEQGVEQSLRTAVREMSFLDGAFEILNTWARDNDRTAQRIMLDLYPSSWEQVKKEESPK